MIADYCALTSPFDLFTDLDEKLAALNRELCFVAKTIARLQHRHDASLIFSSSSKRSSTQLQPKAATTSTPTLQRRHTVDSSIMFRRLLTPRKGNSDDIESHPTSPSNTEHPACLTSGPKALRPLRDNQTDIETAIPDSPPPENKGLARVRPLSESQGLPMARPPLSQRLLSLPEYVRYN
ncbi:hypothetical protein BAUCODRAFT_382435 [Baudoinia panamericana UAMH 10762]|uniref:Uncharacterized protein n=1 Tax=Baudoinia panamericana (strain UAMH 10762) TaxID=717646 RepID=M2MPZ7_BAUPA|nr:uncharacterized protein BAUCODRAFT_382435 [Baudoinia panamericana UAMH 10762]EMC98846.1 hypothetical protein BAUCODRAFT_382435 [Baudoinia panamericana UAMH 10762]